MKSTVTSTAPRPSPATSFRLLLQAELARRCAANVQYSLRAFAMHLDVDHSTLSQILRGKRALTEKTIESLGNHLGLDRATIERYVANERRFATTPAVVDGEILELTRDAVNLVSDWYHWAILELVRLDDFRPDSRWIAQVLGITVDEVNLALSRLLHLGLLEMVDRTHWVDRSGDTTASLADFSRVAIQRLFEQVRRLSLAAVNDVPTAFRDHSSTTLAVSTAQLSEALERIARFRRELIAFLEQGDKRDDVYQLEIGFFPLTNLRERRKDE
ncbi:MAG: TIGR02147 family protein [Planctomycetes bacterium]|nr:TIGR02147 family protein [Planctomycetota bacterium]MBI3844381.1 TIGR02147 family protein [Planctomycetota bacterium]